MERVGGWVSSRQDNDTDEIILLGSETSGMGRYAGHLDLLLACSFS